MPTIAARPYEFRFEPAHLALVVIDMQRDFLEPGGFGAALGNDVSLLAPIVPNVALLLKTIRGLGLTVIHTRRSATDRICRIVRLPKRNQGRGALPCASTAPWAAFLSAGNPAMILATCIKHHFPARLYSRNPARVPFALRIFRKNWCGLVSRICSLPA